MDGKNVADFIDTDIEEKLDALERAEERLQAEGFYDSDDDIVRPPLSLPSARNNPNSRSAHHALSKKITSQSVKKAQKNHARLLRTDCVP
jgi:nucleolar GTP-binding protein